MRRFLTLLALLPLAAAGALGADEFDRVRRTFDENMKGGTAEGRLASVQSVATFGNEESTRLLVSAIGTEADRIDKLLARREAVRTGRESKGGDRGREEALAELKDRLDAECRVLEAIETALAALEDRKAIQHLATSVLTRAKHWRTRLAAARALAAIGDRSLVAPLAKALRDKDARVRAEALAGLGELRAEEAFEAVLGMLEDEEWTVRAAAIEALGTIRDARAFEPLLARMEEEEGRLAEQCAEALAKITGQDFGRAADVWRRWWAENRERILAGDRPEEPAKPEPAPPGEGAGYYHGIPVRSNRTIFIIDVSDSMSYSSQSMNEKPKKGEISRIELAKRELIRAVESYDPHGEFGLIAFHRIIVPWRPRLVPANAVMKKDATDWARKLEPTGTTNIYDALETAFRMAGMGGDARRAPAADTIFLLSDGAPTNADLTEDDPGRILRAVREWNRSRHLRINTIGLKGHSAYFMSELARQNGGTYAARE